MQQFMAQSPHGTPVATFAVVYTWIASYGVRVWREALLGSHGAATHFSGRICHSTGWNEPVTPTCSRVRTLAYSNNALGSLIVVMMHHAVGRASYLKK